MKKKLLILASIAPLFALGQVTTYVGEGAFVKVKPNTLYKNIGEFKVKEASSNQGKVSNEGNVNVQGKFTGNEDGSGFVNEWISGTSYGQLIIKDDATVSGKITGEYKFAPKTKFSYFPMAFPYAKYKSTEAVRQSGITSANWRPQVKSATRYKSPLFYVDNLKQQNDNIQKDEELKPYGSYSINQYSYNINSDVVKSFIGVPNNKAIPLVLSSFDFDVMNNNTNDYGEYYGSYIVDPTRQKPEGWDDYTGSPVSSSTSEGNYGSNLFMLGNPYTSNIDFKSYIVNTDNKVRSFILDENSEYYEDGKASTVSVSKVISVDENGDLIGPKTYTVVRPYQVFTIATQNGEDLNLNLNNSFKVFDPIDNAEGVVLANAAAYPSDRLEQSTSSVEPPAQLSFQLFHNGRYRGNEFFIVAGIGYNPRGENSFEAYNTWIGDGLGFYTLQEDEDGSIYEPSRNQKVYTNAINKIDYVAKPVHLVFQGKNNLDYTLKAELDGLKSGEKFYFEDKKKGLVLEITPDFEYTFSESNYSDDRFIVYWNGIPDTMGTENVDLVSESDTKVYREASDFKIKFSNEFKSANVYVYNLQGQIVLSDENVNTSNDYIISNLPNNNVYIVKIVGNNGVIVTKKIIK